ncbi:terminase large subunit [Oceanicella sp. SM1341]|uniref:terminase large subunit n=1 Tax=Oceanicella sp. SM1341 TaxID=1548889 RepID=UPI000E4F5190|nr:terminase TerL endonuclease subunit [Oceanicella sp. SM1341]
MSDDASLHPAALYARDVVAGKVAAGELVRLACERHLSDLDTGHERGLSFDCAAASRILKFAGMVKHTTGPLAGEPIRLSPWQQFRFGSVFGWKREDGRRRFRSSYTQVAQKNGKTTDTGIPAIYCTALDGEAAPQVYCAATTRDQAGLLFKEIKRMIAGAPVLAALLDAQKYEISCALSGGTISSLSRDGQSADGINPHFVSMDELHRWADRELAEIVRNSMIARAQPLEWMITTAGASRASYCGEVRTYAEKVLRGSVSDDSLFAYVAEPPADADPGDPATWEMGNPNLDVSVPRGELARLHSEAVEIPGRMPNFRRLHLNLWTEGMQTWIADDTWRKGDMPWELEECRGMKAWAGLDMSSTVDTSALALAIPFEGAIRLHVWTFLPAGADGFIARAQRENKDFVAWRDAGWLEVHDDAGAIEEDKILERLMWIKERFRLQELAYDRWGMASMRRRILARGLPLVEHGQGFASMSAPMKAVEKAVVQGRIHHRGNPTLAWAVGNVYRDEDAAENIKPNKRKSWGRIDPAVAAIMAVGRAEVGASAVRERGEMRFA